MTLGHQANWGFGSDNHATVHPNVLDAIQEANRGHVPSYGEDPWSLHAKSLFQKAFGDKIEVYFVFNGTAANALSLRAMLRPGEAVLCSSCSHLHVDEAAAPEFFTAGKVWALPQQNGKIQLQDLHNSWQRRGDIHFAQSRCLSLTQPTELGTVYSLEELRTLTKWAKEKGLFVHIDGARLALAATHLNVSFAELTTSIGVDVVSFGGTKNGLLGAEAIVVLNPQAAPYVQTLRKQSGQLPSKSRFFAAQFIAYFENDLWRTLATKELSLATYLEAGIKEIPGIQITQPVQSNAVFATLHQQLFKHLRKKFFFYVWDEKTWESRLMVSWDLPSTTIDEFILHAKEFHQ